MLKDSRGFFSTLLGDPPIPLSRFVAAALVLLMTGSTSCSGPADELPVKAEGRAGWLEIPSGTPIMEYDLLPADQRDGWMEFVNDLVIKERPGTESYSFGEAPPTIALDDDGRLFVYDAGNYRVAVFDSSGEFLYQFGSRGQGPGEFNRDARGPIGFLDGRLYVYFGYRQMGLWTPDGEYVDGSEHRTTDAHIVPLHDGTVLASGIVREPSISQALYTVGRFAVTPDGLEQTQLYARVPAGLQPSFAATSSGEAYVSSVGPATQVAAFAADASLRWLVELRGPEGRPVMPTDLLLDGQGRLYVLPRLNRARELPDSAVRTVDVLSPEGEHLAAAKVPDLKVDILWQQARGEFIFGVQTDPETFEWQVVRYRLILPNG